MSDLQTVLLDCEYFPCIGWYQQFLRHEKIWIEKHEYFQRASLRNRCYVAGPNGRLALSVPLEGGRNQRILMHELKISDRDPWQDRHWKTLQACYGRSPYFPYFEEAIGGIFTRKYNFLVDLNLDTLVLMNSLLSVKKEFEMTMDYQKTYPDQVADQRSAFNAAHPGELTDVRYLQPFEGKNGFIAGLSMLDLLFCEGKQSLQLLLSHEK